jgi:hypothetical protein
MVHTHPASRNFSARFLNGMKLVKANKMHAILLFIVLKYRENLMVIGNTCQ